MKRLTPWLNSLKRGVRMTIDIVRARRANWLQVAGLAVFAAGGFVLALWLGLFISGIFLAVIGWALDGDR